jgi:diadenosine tetraphosphate (Ap4A) HIT family hydrolase
MADEDTCFSCGINERPDLPPRERIYVGPGWRVAHAFGTALPGWLVLLPRRHVTALDELTAAESEELGPLLRAITRALREATGCDKTYVALFAEAEGFAHAHFHVIPRHRDLAPELRGPRVFSLLGADRVRSVPDAVMDEIALRIAAVLAEGRETADHPGS